MNISFNRLVFAFHGCDQSVAEKVVSGHEEMHASMNSWDWLGDGIYFWESAPDRAMQWAEELCRLGRIQKPAVIGAVIDLGNCMNLMDVSFHAELMSAYQVMGATSAQIPVNRDKNHALDRKAVNLACQFAAQRGRAYDTVRGAFPEGSPVFPDSKILTQTHVQICVRNPASIIAYFHPRIQQ